MWPQMGLKICLWSALLVLSVSKAAAQDRIIDNNFNGWYNYFGDHPIAGNWGIHLEGQYRRNLVITRWQQLLLRPGVNYQVSKLLLLTAGYGFIRSYPYGEYRG